GRRRGIEHLAGRPPGGGQRRVLAGTLEPRNVELEQAPLTANEDDFILVSRRVDVLDEQQAVAAVDRADRQCGGLAGRAEPGLLHPAKHSQRRLHPKAFAAEERVLALDRCHVSAYSRISAEEPCQEG